MLYSLIHWSGSVQLFKYLICGYIFSYLCRSTFMFNMKAQIKGEGIRLEDMTSLIPVPSTLPTERPHPHPSFWWGPWWAGAGAWISSEAPGLSQTPSFSLYFVKGCPRDQRTRTIDVSLSITRQFVQATPTIVTAAPRTCTCTYHACAYIILCTCSWSCTGVY